MNLDFKKICDLDSNDGPFWIGAVCGFIYFIYDGRIYTTEEFLEKAPFEYASFILYNLDMLNESAIRRVQAENF